MNTPATSAWLDQDDARLATTIRSFGWSVECVGYGMCSAPGCDDHEPSRTPFAYTVGLFGLGHPELLVFSMCPEMACLLLNEVGERMRAGHDLIPGEMLTFDDWPVRVVPEVVPNPGDIVFGANRHYRRDGVSVPVLQLTWDDEGGRFPWEDGYQFESHVQPRPGEFDAWGDEVGTSGPMSRAERRRRRPRPRRR